MKIATFENTNCNFLKIIRQLEIIKNAKFMKIATLKTRDLQLLKTRNCKIVNLQNHKIAKI